MSSMEAMCVNKKEVYKIRENHVTREALSMNKQRENMSVSMNKQGEGRTREALNMNKMDEDINVMQLNKIKI